MPAPQTLNGGESDGASDAAPAGIVRAPQATEARTGETEKPLHTHWYGWQTLATDGAAVAVLAAAIAASGGVGKTRAPAWGFSFATFALGGPMVHLAHGRGDVMAASLGIRFGLATAGYLAGTYTLNDCSSASNSDEGFCYVRGGLIGMSIGAAGAMIIDAAFLAREDVPRERTAALSFSPAVSVTKSSGTVGLAGAF